MSQKKLQILDKVTLGLHANQDRPLGLIRHTEECQ